MPSTTSIPVRRPSGDQPNVQKFHELLFGVIRALTSAIDARDPYTRGHSERVARIAAQLGKYLKMNPRDVSNLYLAGLLHDVGKIGIDDNVLKKPGKLTPEEYKHVMSHVEIGVSIVQEIGALRYLVPSILHHHERYSGGGYPQGIAGDQIPRLARILAVADGFDAMFNDRPYRPRRSPMQVRQILQEESGHQWDPVVVDAALGSWIELTRIQEHGLGNSLRMAVEKAITPGDSRQAVASSSAIDDDGHQ